MTARFALVLALGAGLSGCNLLPKEEEQVAPEGTVAVPVDEARDVPKNAQGQPVDVGDGPVLQALGSLAGVDLGPRVGGCTFQHSDGRELFITAAAQSTGVVARGAVRSGGVIVMLQSSAAIGVEGLQAGATLTDGTITVQVRRAPGEGQKQGGVTIWNANLGVTAGGMQRLYSPGKWVCA